MEPRDEYYQINGEQIVSKLEERGMEGYYCDNQQEGLEQVLNLLKEGSSISWGGSMTLEELQIKDKLNTSDYEVYDRAQAESAEEKEEIYHQALNCDYYLMSTNALTRDGKLVNTDGRGNRLAALVYGPTNVIVVAGMNKLAADEAAARQRIKNKAAPMNAMRLDRDTPCVKAGYCLNCLGESSICSQTVITRRSHVKNRIKVVLIGEKLGY